ncbi:MAG: uracil-DNA glycosylase [Candidatus Nanohaloarchaea archaeon]|nr:uracil-DNA glycosylase [Candidatus Nanohaloarchaea archaeon]
MSQVQDVFERERDDLASTELCKNATNFVDFRGSEDPVVLFVGEAPGREEDLQGKPFVGRSGDLLDDWVDELGLDEDDYAITNVVKCRPPENRTPTDEEAERFGKWLDEEIDAMQPDLIVPLGKTGATFLIDGIEEKSFVKDVCEHVFETEHGQVYPLPHPAYALRSGFEPDFDGLRKVIHDD